jgi:uncharacterized protein DUF4245
MSESREPAPASSPRYPRSSGGLVGAMVVTVLAVLAFVAFRAVTRDNEPTPVRSVDYTVTVKAAVADKKLQVLVPDPVPAGWKVTSATYTPGASAAFHLGMLTDQRKYVGVEEALSSVQDLVTEHVDAAAERGKDVTIDGETWQTWTDAGGDYAVARSQRDGDTTDSWIVVGTAPEQEIRDLAGSLEPGGGS